MKNSQIKIIQTTLMTSLVCFASFAYAGKFPAVMTAVPYSYEYVANRLLLIQSVSNNLITVDNKKYAIAAVTKIINSNGQPVKASELKKGMLVNIVFDDKQRYLNQPTLSAIYIN